MKHDQNLFTRIVGVLGWRFILTGSFIVNMDTANDIDLVFVWNENIHEKLLAIGAENTNIKGYKGKAKTLESTWRLGVYNILVVKDEIAFALWGAFSNVIKEEEYAFVDKADRIKLADKIFGAYRSPTLTIKKKEF